MDAPDDWPYPDFDPVARADERATLVAFLDGQRAAFEARCDGLTAEQMAMRACEPSSMSLLGLLRHMAGVESGWFRTVMGGDHRPRPFSSPDDPDHEFNAARSDDKQVEAAWVAWRAEVESARGFVADATDLEITGIEKWRGPMSLRWVLIHMIEEYAQHSGHADLLRERVDGTTYRED